MDSRGFRKVIPALLVILLSTSSLAGAETAGFGFARQIAVYADGHHEVRDDVYDVGADRVWVSKAGVGPNPRAAYPSALVTNTYHWERGAKIRFRSTETATPFREPIRRILGSLNAMRGTSGVPTLTLGDEFVEVRPPSAFSDLSSYATQLDMDGISTVVMTEDDLLIATRMGSPDPLFAVIFFAVVEIYEEVGASTADGGAGTSRYVGELRIQEADVYLASFFFEFPNSTYERYGSHAFRGALGYQHTCWPSDLLGVANLNTTDLDIWNENGPMARILKERDRFYYRNQLPRTGGFHGEPKMMPAPETVIDLAPYGDIPTEMPAFGRPVIALTNLVAFDGAKKLQVRIYRLKQGPKPKLRKLVKVKGNLNNWPMSHPEIGMWYPTVFLNEIRLGRDKHVTKLRNAVDQFGAPAVVDGRRWEKALRVKVKLTGWWAEDGPKRRLTRYLYLTDSAQEP